MREETQSIVKELGGSRFVASVIGCKPQAVVQWKAIPPQHVLKLAEAKNYDVTPHRMRKDLYPNVDDAIPEEHRARVRARAALPQPAEPARRLQEMGRKR